MSSHPPDPEFNTWNLFRLADMLGSGWRVVSPFQMFLNNNVFKKPWKKDRSPMTKPFFDGTKAQK